MKRTAIAALATVALMTAGGLRAGDEEETVQRQVRTIVIECEGDDCDTGAKVMALGEGNAVLLSDDDCEGEDCERHAYVFKTGKAPFAFSHGAHDFHFFGPARGFLGVQFVPLTPELSEHFNTGSESGVMVSKVIEDSPAAAAGLQVGDVITSVDGDTLGPGGLMRALAGREGGDVVDLGVVRNGRSMILSAALEDRELGVAPRSERIGKRRIEVRKLRGKVGMIDTEELCEGLEECEVKIVCEDDEECTCEVNGAAVECP